MKRLFSFTPVTLLFRLTYFCFLLVVHTAAALTKYILLHAVCIQLGHITLDAPISVAALVRKFGAQVEQECILRHSMVIVIQM